MTSRQNAHIGVAYIEAAVLGALENAPDGLQPREISQRLGISSYSEGPGDKSYGIIHGILAKLYTEGMVQRVEEGVRHSPWKLTGDP